MSIPSDEPHYDKERTTEFGKWLTETRLARGLTQAEVAYHVGLNPGRISEFEQGLKEPQPALRRRLRSVLRP